MLHDFELKGERVKFWQRPGESYEHVLMKALGFVMFIGEFPDMQIEKTVGLRYKPDLVAQNSSGEFVFWGECGANSIRKTAWLLKHARVEKLVLFKIGRSVNHLVWQLREEVPVCYRENDKLSLINFVSNITELTESKSIGSVLPAWYAETKI